MFGRQRRVKNHGKEARAGTSEQTGNDTARPGKSTALGLSAQSRPQRPDRRANHDHRHPRQRTLEQRLKEFRPHDRRLHGDDDEQHRGDEPQQAGQPLASLVNGTDGLQTEIRGAVRGEKHSGKHRHGQRVPIEDADAASRTEVGEQRHAEHAAAVNRDSPDHIPERGSKQDRKQDIRGGKHKVPARSPERIVDVTADLDRDPTQHERPEHHPERKVEAGERHGHELWKREDECAARGDEPHLMPAPERTDGRDHLSPLRVVLRHQKVQRSRPDVPAVKDDEQRQHETEEREPQFNQWSPSLPLIRRTVKAELRGRGRARLPCRSDTNTEDQARSTSRPCR